MFIITMWFFGTKYYCGWQEPPWNEESGYFWTTKNNIQKLIEIGFNTKDHPFLFSTIKDTQKIVEKMNLTKNYSIEEY